MTVAVLLLLAVVDAAGGAWLLRNGLRRLTGREHVMAGMTMVVFSRPV